MKRNREALVVRAMVGRTFRLPGTMTEVGSSLGVAVLNARFAALLPAALAGAGSFPAALAAAWTDADRAQVANASAPGRSPGRRWARVPSRPAACSPPGCCAAPSGPAEAPRPRAGLPDTGRRNGA